MRRVLVLAAMVLLAACGARAQPEKISHGRFNDVQVYAPRGEVRAFVLLLSGQCGWDARAQELARRLAGQGAMVAGIATPQLLEEFARDGADCAYAVGDFENLSHYVQAYKKLPGYLLPRIAGVGEGGTLAYMVLAQAAPDIFAGAISFGFCPQIALRQPLCEGEGLHWTRAGERLELAPAAKLAAPWIAVEEPAPACPAGVTKAFVGGVRGARIEDSESVAIASVLGQPRQSDATVAGELADLPIVEVPASGSGDSFAVMLSGDGGWAGLDKNVAAALAAQGVPVVGLDSLRYFWTARTPEGLAADLARILGHYQKHWGKHRALLLGYSQGANVLPFAVNRLPQAARESVALTVLMGLEQQADFEFHLGNWVGHSSGRPILPEMQRLDRAHTLCLYGEGENDSLCPRLDPANARVEKLPGGHHFGGDYGQLAQLVLEAGSSPAGPKSP